MSCCATPKIAPGARFCSSCGKPAGAPPAAAAPTQQAYSAPPPAQQYAPATNGGGYGQGPPYGVAPLQPQQQQQQQPYGGGMPVPYGSSPPIQQQSFGGAAPFGGSSTNPFVGLPPQQQQSYGAAVPYGTTPPPSTTSSAAGNPLRAMDSWLEPTAFGDDSLWESGPVAEGSVQCEMCGYMCDPGTQNCPECDNAMGYGGAPGVQESGGSRGGSTGGSGGNALGGDFGGVRSPQFDGGAGGAAPQEEDTFDLSGLGMTPPVLTSGQPASRKTSSSSVVSSASKDGLISEDLANKPWYEGPMTRPDAEAMLAAEPTGSFLVRQRLNTEGLALALKAPGKIRHYLVVENSGHWRLMTGSPSPFFPSLDELIEYYARSSELGGIALRLSDGKGPAGSSRRPASMPSDPMSGSDGEGNGAGERQIRSRDSGGAAVESATYRKLTDAINATGRLFDLISLGNAILDAENDKVLYDGELVKLRRSYRIRRSILSYGCKKKGEAWQPNKEAKACTNPECGVKFTVTSRRHHCRACGGCMCKGCTSLKFERAGLKLSKVCPLCYSFLSDVAAGRVKEAVEKYGPQYAKQKQ